MRLCISLCNALGRSIFLTYVGLTVHTPLATAPAKQTMVMKAKINAKALLVFLSNVVRLEGGDLS